MPAKGEHIKKYCRDITNEVLSGNITRLVGRDNDIENVLKILNQDDHNNIIVVGDPGVGKTSLIEGIAYKISRENIKIKDKVDTIFELKPSNIFGGAIYVGMWEGRFNDLINDLLKNPNVMLFIDEIHTLVQQGNSANNSTNNAANFLKTYLNNGQIIFIGATTKMEYDRYISEDPAFKRRFNKYVLDEPNKENTIKMLKQISKYEEIENNVIINDNAIEEIYLLASKYLFERKFPDKGIELLKESISYIKNDKKYTYDDILSIIDNHIDNLNDEVNTIRKFSLSEIIDSVDKWFEIRKKFYYPTVTKEIVRNTISKKTGINILNADINIKDMIIRSQKCFDDTIIGQKKATEAIGNALKRMFTGLRNEERPIGSFLFLGPSGVGKTEIAKTLALILWGDKKKFIRYDMSEIRDKCELIGNPYATSDYEKKGRLIKDINANPFSVLLFDEIEKTYSPEIYDIFLQMLDEGHITGADGKKAYLNNTIIIMTSNLSPEIIKKYFRPELLNRIDEIVLFHHLTKNDLEKIFYLTFNEYKNKIEKNNKITMAITDKLVKHIIEANYDVTLGARPIRRAIEQNINTKISELIINNKIQASQKIIFDLIDTNIICKVE